MGSLLQIAVRNVVRNVRRTAITLAALLLGVGVMVSIRGTLNGLQRSMKESMVLAQTGAVQVHKKGYLKNVLSSPLHLDMEVGDALVKRILAVPHVTAVAPRILFGGMVNLGDQTLFMATLALDPKREFEVCPKRRDLFDARAKAFGTSADGMVITVELAKGLGAKLTEPAALLAPDKDGALSGENATILGTMQLTSPGERKIGIVPLPLAQHLLKMEGRATELAIAVDDLENAPLVAAALERALGPEFEVHTWDNVATFFKDILFRQDFLLSLIATVFLVLMLLGVANTMLMSVLDRTREIGTMMALGVRRSRIVTLFLVEAAVIGVFGGCLGGLLGSIVVAWLHVRGIEVTMPTSAVPFVIQPFVDVLYIVKIVCLSGIGALVFAVYPAWRASRLRPVQALAGG
ncbi:MAG: ABC transporter permease [Myxococcales bacterium]|nr:ABC transporter permease [Myxococcales bacterium]